MLSADQTKQTCAGCSLHLANWGEVPQGAEDGLCPALTSSTRSTVGHSSPGTSHTVRTAWGEPLGRAGDQQLSRVLQDGCRKTTCGLQSPDSACKSHFARKAAQGQCCGRVSEQPPVSAWVICCGK